MRSIAIYFTLVLASVRSQMAYRASFLIECLGRTVVTGLELVPIFFLFARLNGEVRGWTTWQIIYLYGIAGTAMGIGEIITSGLNTMPELIRSGEFDRTLVRPASPLAQTLGRTVRLYAVGRLVQAGAALVVATAVLELPWTFERALVLAMTIVSAATVYIALFIISAANCFWTVQRNEMFNAFTYGGVELTQYPITFYRPWLRRLFLFVVPVGFVSYFPSLIVLDKVDALGYPGYFAWLALPVALLFAVIALSIWRLGLDHYQSTGS